MDEQAGIWDGEKKDVFFVGQVEEVARDAVVIEAPHAEGGFADVPNDEKRPNRQNRRDEFGPEFVKFDARVEAQEENRNERKDVNFPVGEAFGEGQQRDNGHVIHERGGASRVGEPQQKHRQNGQYQGKPR